MPALPDWDAATAIQRCSVINYEGMAWRIHNQRYRADDSGGSLHVSGRYHRGLDSFAEEQAWAALYLALRPEIALAELVRHITPERLSLLNHYDLTKLDISLSDVIDLRDTTSLRLQADDLYYDTEYEITQELARAAFQVQAEGILVPSATNLGDNLVVFPAQLRRGSIIKIVDSRRPRLYVNRQTEQDS